MAEQLFWDRVREAFTPPHSDTTLTAHLRDMAVADVWVAYHWCGMVVHTFVPGWCATSEAALAEYLSGRRPLLSAEAKEE